MAFEGCKVCLKLDSWEIKHDFDRKILRDMIEEGGGSCTKDAKVATHVLAESEEHLGDIPDGVRTCGILWLFACLEASRMLDENATPLYKPFPSRKMDSLVEPMYVSVTGFKGLERRLVHTAVQSIGATYQHDLKLIGSEKAHVLIARDVGERSMKTDAAR